MTALAGIYGKNPSWHTVDRMSRRIVHRGNDENIRIEHGNALMHMGMGRAEKAVQASLSSGFFVWDGICPPMVDTATLSRWPSPFVVAAISNGDLLIARDLLGAKPLYYGDLNGAFVFASEAKALLQVTSDVHEFPPGHIYTTRQGFQEFASIQTTGEWLADSADSIVAELRNKIKQAIERFLISDSVGVWLSGGVDSSVIATLLSRRVRKLRSFVIGLDGTPDLEYGGQVASVLGTEHHAVTITLNDLLAVLPDAIYALESFDALLVRSSVTHYLISQRAAEFVEIILTGEGGDEFFAGYEYMKNYSLEQLPHVLELAAKSLHNTAFQRVDRCATVHGLIPCFPFADRDVIEYALRIPPQYKLHQQSGKRIEKWILRRVIEKSIPDSILWRPKTKFWQGTGVQELLRQYADERISDSDFGQERLLPNGWQLNSKEELLYYRIFREHFGEASNLEWMGRTEIPTHQE